MIKKIISTKILILFLLIFIQSFQVIAENQNPSKWVENISNRALIILGDNSIDEKNKIELLENIFIESLDIKRISLFILGPYRRNLKQSESSQYFNAIKDFISKVYAKRLSSYSSGNIKVIKIEERGKRGVIVASLITPPNLAALKKCVILLHGLARSEASFALLERSLRVQEFVVVNPGYSSNKKPIAALVQETLPAAVAAVAAVAACEELRINFVTHSLGGILVREYLAHLRLDKLGRVVMLGLPGQRSQVVDVTRKLMGFNFFNGLAGHQWSTDQDSVPNQLPPVDFSLGVFAGKIA